MAETKIISGKGFPQEKERERREKRHERPEPFWPRFSTKTTTIYARPFGSDERGDGSLKKPFRTFQHAIRFVPALIPPSQRYVVDITGIGTETLPADYAIPEIVNSRTFFIDLTDPDFVTQQGFEIRATPQLASNVPAADASIAAADVAAVTIDPTTLLVTITLNTPRASWAGNALAGKFLKGSPLIANIATIWASTDTSISIATINPQPSPPWDIVEPSATLQGSNVVSNSAVIAPNNGMLGIKGVQFVNTNAGPFNAALGLEGCTFEPFVEQCDIAGFNVGHESDCVLLNCYVHAKAFGLTASLLVLGSFFNEIPNFFQWGFTPTNLWLNGTVWQACPAIGPRPNTFGTNVGWGTVNLRMQSSLVINPIEDILPVIPEGFVVVPPNGIFVGGGTAYLQNVRVSGAPANGIFVGNANGFLELLDVFGGTGAPGDPVNAGFGLSVQDGGIVRVRDNFTSITGALGDMSVGTLAVRPWIDFRTNPPIKNQYDLTTPFVSATYAPTQVQPPGEELTGAGTGGRSGSRVYERP